MERLLKRSRCYIILAEILPIQRKTPFQSINHLNRPSRRYVTGTLPIRLTINRRGLIWRMFRRMCISKALWDFFGGFGVHLYLNLIRTRLADRSIIDWLIDWLMVFYAVSAVFQLNNGGRMVWTLHSFKREYTKAAKIGSAGFLEGNLYEILKGLIWKIIFICHRNVIKRQRLNASEHYDLYAGWRNFEVSFFI